MRSRRPPRRILDPLLHRIPKWICAALWLGVVLPLGPSLADDAPPLPVPESATASRKTLEIDAPTYAVIGELLVAKPHVRPAEGSMAVWTVIHDDMLLDEDEAFDVDESAVLVIHELEPGDYKLVLVVTDSAAQSYGVGLAVVRVRTPFPLPSRRDAFEPLTVPESEYSPPPESSAMPRDIPESSDESPPLAGQAILAEANSTSISPFLLAVPLMLIVTGVGWGLWLAPEVVTRDSAAFTHALAVWHEVIAAKCTTPRAFKRYMNRLRFLAMRKGVADTEPTQWTALRNKLRQFAKVPQVDATATSAPRCPLEEPMLVALCAIHLLNPDWISEDSLWEEIAEGLHDSEPPNERIAAELEMLQRAIDKHREVFGSWEPDEAARQALLELFAQIRAN